MRKMRWLMGLILLVSYTLLATSCDKLGIAPPQKIDIDGNSASEYVTIAVGPDGGRHMAARIVSYLDPYSTVVYYYDGPAGKKSFTKTPLLSDYLVKPSLAVTDSNIIYIAYLDDHYNPGSSQYSVCWWSFQISNISIGCNEIPTGMEAIYTNLDYYLAPQLVSFGNTVFLTYFAIAADSRIHFYTMRLSPSISPAWDSGLSISPSNPGEYFRKPALSVTNSGTLQIGIFYRKFDPDHLNYHSFYKYIDNTGVVETSQTNDIVSDPSIVIDRIHNKVYFGYVELNKYLCVGVYNLSSFFIETFWDILPSRDWNISGPPSLTWYSFLSLPTTEGLYISFSGDDGIGTDVYYCIFNGTTIPCALYPITNDGDLVVEDAPESVVVNEPDGSTVAIAWRQRVEGDFVLYKDVYVYNTLSHLLSKVFTSFNPQTYGKLSLAAYGAFAAGAWIDDIAESSVFHVPWYSYNANLVYLPLTLR